MQFEWPDPLKSNYLSNDCISIYLLISKGKQGLLAVCNQLRPPHCFADRQKLSITRIIYYYLYNILD